jgi:hypothetical protein
MRVEVVGQLSLSSSLREAAKQTEIELGDVVSELLEGIKEIKDEMLDLEKRINVVGQSERVDLQGLLKWKSDELNDLSDSAVSRSKDSWVKYKNLALRCESEGGDPALLGSVRGFCKMIEVIAADLLCFSLGH